MVWVYLLQLLLSLEEQKNERKEEHTDSGFYISQLPDIFSPSTRLQSVPEPDMEKHKRVVFSHHIDLSFSPIQCLTKVSEM